MALAAHLPPRLREIVDEARAENVPFMAGSIAYQAFVSLIPMLVLLFFLVSAVGGEDLATRVVAYSESFLPADAQASVEQVVTANVAGTAGASIIGLVTLLWGALRIFRGLDTAFAEIYDTEERTSFTGSLADAAIAFASLIGAIVAAAVAVSVVAAFPGLPYVDYAAPLVLVAGLALAFLPMYYVFPEVDLDLREVVPGVVVAAIGWAVLEVLFQVYVSYAGGSSVGGVLGAVLLLLTWLYFSGLVLLVGAVVNAVLAGRTEAQQESVTDSDHPGVETKGAGGDTVDRQRFSQILLGLSRAFADDTHRISIRTGDDDATVYPPDELSYDVQITERPPAHGRHEQAMVLTARWPVNATESESESDATPVERPVRSD